MPRPKKNKEVEEEISLLDLAVAAVRNEWGNTSVFAPGEEQTQMDKDVMSTGIGPLDDILGGGLVEGCIAEIYGLEGAGKTTITLQIMAEAQHRSKKLLFLDMENALKVDYARALGVNVDDMYLSQPNSMEEALGIAETFIKTGEIGVVVIDSLASLVPLEEVGKSTKEQTMGIQPRLMSTWLRRVNPIINKTRTIVIFTNQLRDKIGGYGGTTTPGGKAVKFYASYRIEVRIEEKKKDSQGNVLGNELKLTAVKNKYSRPFRHSKVTLYFGEGIDVVGTTIENATAMGLFIKNGNWYEVNRDFWCKEIDEPLKFNGLQQVRKFLNDYPTRLEELQSAMEAYL